MKFVDTHAHIYLLEFDGDREGVISRAREAGAEALLLPCIDEGSITPMLHLCEAQRGFCFPMLGLHPTELPPTPRETEAVLDRMEAMLSATGNPYVAVGEVGVDLYWDDTRREEQLQVFQRQVEWSVRFGLPLSIHARKAQGEIVSALKSQNGLLPGGVFHCFSGSAEQARELLSFDGFALGIGGVVTFKNSKLGATLREAVPLNRLVVETDAPYLSPAPRRGERNEPAYVTFVIERLAEIYDTEPETVAYITTATAKETFRLA